MTNVTATAFPLESVSLKLVPIGPISRGGGAVDVAATAGVVDRFHLIRLANLALDTIRRRVQNQYFGHRGRKHDPLYRARKLLVMRSDRLDEGTTQRLEALLSLGDPDAEVSLAYRVKEALSDFYEFSNYNQAQEHLVSIIDQVTKSSMPKELQTLGRTLVSHFRIPV